MVSNEHNTSVMFNHLILTTKCVNILAERWNPSRSGMRTVKGYSKGYLVVKIATAVHVYNESYNISLLLN